MKTAKLLTVCLTLFCTNSSIRAQGFINLNFENASFTVDPAGAFPPYSVFASNAIPGWTAYLGGVPQMDILSNTETLGLAAISLQATNQKTVGFVLPAFQGKWSIFLQGFFGSTNGGSLSAAIGQTAQIPITAQSLLFWGNLSLSGVTNDFTVSFNGQNLSLLAISNTLNYTVYGADISAFAGQRGQLLFTANYKTYAELDNIQFSSLPIPEPGVFSLVCLGGGGVLLYVIRRRHR